MRYASIRKLDISNGEEIGVSLFVQGCNQHCSNCFNPETWDFNGGKEWNEEIKNQFLALVDRPYIKRVTLLGGEPLAYGNLCGVYDIVRAIKTQFPFKKIWLYTGYTLSFNVNKQDFFVGAIGDFTNVEVSLDKGGALINLILRLCDVVVDGAYIDNLRDLTLPFRGSSNQRIIDVQNSIKAGQIVLYNLATD